MRKPYATDEQVVDALRAGASVYQVARELRADHARVRRLRDEHGIPPYVRPETVRTIEEKWKLDAREVVGGHIEWTGTRAKNGTPLLSYKDALHTAARVAFRMRTGRDPQGQVFADCGIRHCVAPAHVDDEPGRARTREQFRYLSGGGALKDRCVHGHDLSVHRAFTGAGVAYCRECKRVARQAAAEGATA
jgi:hypothetical protein